jgi:hypothetical protein
MNNRKSHLSDSLRETHNTRLDAKPRDSAKFLDPVDFESSIVGERYRAKANGWNAKAQRIAEAAHFFSWRTASRSISTFRRLKPFIAANN